MALYKQADFARKCGITNAYLSVNKKRGKVILTGEYIDDQDRDNADFMQKCLDKLLKESNNIETKHAKPETILSESTISETGKAKKPDSGRSKYDLETEKKELDIEKTKVETRLLELREEKIRGEVIPIDIVKSIFAQHSQSTITEFKNSVESILTIIAKKKSLNGNEVAEIRGQLVSTINIAVDKAIDYSKKNLSNIVKEFSIKKEVGEHS